MSRLIPHPIKINPRCSRCPAPRPLPRLPRQRTFASAPVDPYRVLGVPRTASQDQVKAAFYKLAKELHPDRAPGNHDAFVKLQAAYQLVSTPRAREEYDKSTAPRNYGYGYSAGYSAGYSGRNYGEPASYAGPFSGYAERVHRSRAQDWDPFTDPDLDYGEQLRRQQFARDAHARTRPEPPPRTRRATEPPQKIGPMTTFLVVFATLATSLSVFHLTRMRRVVGESIELKNRESMLYLNESRARSGKGLGEEMRTKRKVGASASGAEND